MASRNHAACVGNYYTAILIITGRSLLAQFGLTPTDADWLRVLESAHTLCQHNYQMS